MKLKLRKGERLGEFIKQATGRFQNAIIRREGYEAGVKDATKTTILKRRSHDHAIRRAALEEACNALCTGCTAGHPLDRADLHRFTLKGIPYGKPCNANAIRALMEKEPPAATEPGKAAAPDARPCDTEVPELVDPAEADWLAKHMPPEAT